MKFKIRCTMLCSGGLIGIRKVCDTDSPEIADYAYAHTMEMVGKDIIILFMVDNEISKIDRGKYK